MPAEGATLTAAAQAALRPSSSPEAAQGFEDLEANEPESEFISGSYMCIYRGLYRGLL